MAEVQDGTLTAKRAKYLAGKTCVKMGSTLLAGWADVRYDAMVLRHKFSRGRYRYELANTHRGAAGVTYILEERTSRDDVWGTGSDLEGGQGLNLLGKALAAVRDEILGDEPSTS